MFNKKVKVEIKTFGGEILFEYEAKNNTIRETLQKAVSEGADLKGADLRGADLRGADLRGADLRGADLRGAYLRGAYLKGADLEGADLEGADLRGAYLRGAYLEGADLRGAYLRGAYLRGAYLKGAYLKGAKNIPQWFIDICSRDMLYAFRYLKGELPFLRDKIVAGEIDGSQYEGECACLVGTLAKAKGVDPDKLCSRIPYYQKSLANPGEQWFFQIRPGDTPDNSEFAKHALALVDSVLAEDGAKKKAA